MSTPTTPDQLRDLALKYAEEKNRVAWLELFTEDAVVEDPVGKPPHTGKKELSAWWDKSVAKTGSFKAEVILSRTCGDECGQSLFSGLDYWTGLLDSRKFSLAGNILRLAAPYRKDVVI